MAGFLQALGLMVPIGQGLRAAGQTADVTQTLEQQRESQRTGFGHLMNALPNTPEWQPFKEAWAGGKGMSPTDLTAAMSGMLPIFENIQRQQQFHDIFQKPEDFKDPAKLAQYELEAGKEPSEGLLRLLSGESLDKPTGEAAQFEQYQKMTPEARKAYDDFVKQEAELKRGPVKWQTFPGGDITDPGGSGYSLKTRTEFNPETTEMRQVITGVHLTGQQMDTLSQAGEVVRAIPQVSEAAAKVQAALGGKPTTDEQARAQRHTLLSQYRAYNAARKASGMDALNPHSWGWWNNYGNVRPEFAEYFTLMGQLQAQAAAPMHIFRSQGLFQQIAPHLDAPEDLPYLNVDRLRAMHNRWQGDLDTLNRLQAGIADEPEVKEFISKASATPLPPIPPVDPWPEVAPPEKPISAHSGEPFGGGKPIWKD